VLDVLKDVKTFQFDRRLGPLLAIYCACAENGHFTISGLKVDPGIKFPDFCLHLTYRQLSHVFSHCWSIFTAHAQKRLHIYFLGLIKSHVQVSNEIITIATSYMRMKHQNEKKT